MTSTLPQTTNISIRPFQHRDLAEVQRLFSDATDWECSDYVAHQSRRWEQINRWYGVLKFLSLFPNPLQHLLNAYVAHENDYLRGVIQVSPFNRSRTTWRIDQVLTNLGQVAEGEVTSQAEIGSQLLRHCFQTIWEARTWLTEINVNDKDSLALYRHNGFQPLAQMTYWAIAPELLNHLAEREPDLPNLLPVSNADACLLHQLDTVSMPPLVRQVFDRQPHDFRASLLGAVVDNGKHRIEHTDVVSNYVFESQRKAAIGYYRLQLNKDGTRPHSAHLTVHPAYTWLYPELLSQMARVARGVSNHPLRLTSTDYQPEREEYLEQIGATRIEHTLMMSRSVWHKVRETRFVSLEGLQLSEVLQGFQPARKPVPGRFSLLESIRQLPQTPKPNDDKGSISSEQ
ncbi:GNAT family N-acetyltransferase [Oscillatoria sp. FACHB-1407]|uniref:GNAT family N-acetyltransferase n=1 Tax=Oscillatoria sp. FACHB-1407 TaxID=2692847 RepID=UPI0016824F3B|nr:GNAT family N-acetyltransferase [Oscillatoria sp. FACHB-1407]MBD2465948.1 GNAT family N-acetyltransferase [Oscillatoria sp. FACHB-1407]